MLLKTRRAFIRECLFAGLAGSSLVGNFSMQTANANPAPRIPVLLYHQVGDAGGHLTVTAKGFDTDLSLLEEEGFQSISLAQFQAALRGEPVSLPQRPILLTFDDGYLDNYLNAFPILRKHKMSAVFYVITSLINEYDRLAVGHIREMASAGMFFGSHTVSHRSLGDLEPNEIDTELIRSKKVMEDVLRQKVDTVAYPKGSFNPMTIQSAENMGYWGGFSIHPGVCTPDINPYALRRIPVFSFDSNVFRAMAKRGRA